MRNFARTFVLLTFIVAVLLSRATVAQGQTYTLSVDSAQTYGGDGSGVTFTLTVNPPFSNNRDNIADARQVPDPCLNSGFTACPRAFGSPPVFHFAPGQASASATVYSNPVTAPMTIGMQTNIGYLVGNIVNLTLLPQQITVEFNPTVLSNQVLQITTTAFPGFQPQTWNCGSIDCGFLQPAIKIQQGDLIASGPCFGGFPGLGVRSICTITAPNVTAVTPATAGVELDFAASSTPQRVFQPLTILPAQQKFALNLGRDGKGNALVHIFDQGNQSITDPFVVKLGQQFPMEVAPVQPDGTTGTPIVITEQIQNATPANPLGGGSSIPGPVTVLFSDKVLVHFAQSQSETHHNFFPIHSGTATMQVTFTYNGNQNTLTFPVKVTSCVVEGDCTPQLGKRHSTFDDLMMTFADRNGIPPQLIKAQVGQESAFRPNAFPLSIDWAEFNSSGSATVSAALQPWLLGQSSDCSTISAPAGSNIVLSSPDVTPRQGLYGVFINNNGNPLCRVMNIPTNPVARGITSTDALLSMENILYTNDACFFNGCAFWTTINAGAFGRFANWQVDNPPFTGQTVVASSYGLHQLLYGTAVGMGYKNNGVGMSPHMLFDPFTSLDLGSRYLAITYQNNGGLEDVDFSDSKNFFFQFGPALRDFNGPPSLSFDDIFSTCANTPYVASPRPSPFDYPCLILQATPGYAPSPM